MKFREWSEGCRVSVLVVSEREMVRLWVFLEGSFSVSSKGPGVECVENCRVFFLGSKLPGVEGFLVRTFVGP